MRFCSLALPAMALLASAFHSADAGAPLALPWDGRAENLTVATLTDKYETHILTQRQSNPTADPAKWVTIDQTGRSPGFNDDTGVINIAVDDAAIFNGETTFRRSELVQNLEGNAAGATFFRTSFMKSKAFINKHAWQAIFTESHVFTMTIDATLAAPMIYFYDSSYKTQWSTKFVVGTWYNFGIAITSSSMVLYASEGDADLAKVATVALTSSASDYEYHFGLFTLTTDGSQPTMVAGEQDILSFNGVSVENSVVTTGASSGSATKTTTTTAASSAASESAEASSSAASEADEASASSAASASTTETSESASAETTAAPTTTATATPTSTTATPTATTAVPTATTATPTATKDSCNTRRSRRN